MALTPYAELLGVRLTEASADRVLAELDFRPQVQQLTGVFHAASLVGVAKAAATECAQLAAGADAAPLTLAPSTQRSSSALPTGPPPVARCCTSTRRPTRSRSRSPYTSVRAFCGRPSQEP